MSPATRAGVPQSTPTADTNPITITHGGIRGIAYKRGGTVETGNFISGTIEGAWPRRKKTR